MGPEKNYLKEQKAVALRAAGLTYAAIGRSLGVKAERARILVRFGRAEVPPDEIVYLPGLKAETPSTHLPLSIEAREGLMDAGIMTLGDLAAADFEKLHRVLNRYPGVGPLSIDRIQQLLFDWGRQIRR
ncbi:MAG TPA: hypothetical protein VFJ46_17765 [Xanthobacteraceae bacterium]|nr:hypothetical protein [Xanthobacteraceae bacterium]